MVTLSAQALQTFPTHIERSSLMRLLEETRAKEILLKNTIQHLEGKYQC